MVSYKLDNYWSKFTKVEPNPNTPDKVNIYKKLELTSELAGYIHRQGWIAYRKR